MAGSVALRRPAGYPHGAHDDRSTRGARHAGPARQLAEPDRGRRGAGRVEDRLQLARGAAAAAGDLSAVVRHVADWLAAFGERLRAGDRIICGSLAPPILVKAGDRVRVDLGRLGGVETALTA